MGAGMGVDCCTQRDIPQVDNDTRPARRKQTKQQKPKPVEPVIRIDNPQEATSPQLSFRDCTPRAADTPASSPASALRDTRDGGSKAVRSSIPDGTCGHCKKKVTAGIRFCSLACKEAYKDKQNQTAAKESAAQARAEAAKRKAQAEAERKAKAEADLKAKAEQAEKKAAEKKVTFRKSRTEAPVKAECLVCQKPLRSAITKYCSLDCKDKDQADARPARHKSSKY